MSFGSNGPGRSRTRTSVRPATADGGPPTTPAGPNPIAAASGTERNQVRSPRTTNDPRPTYSPASGVFETWSGRAAYTSASKCPARQAPENEAANCATSSMRPVGPFTITTEAPWTSACTKVSFPSMYRLTDSSFWPASRPPRTSAPSEVSNQRNRWYQRGFSRLAATPAFGAAFGGAAAIAAIAASAPARFFLNFRAWPYSRSTFCSTVSWIQSVTRSPPRSTSTDFVAGSTLTILCATGLSAPFSTRAISCHERVSAAVARVVITSDASV